MAHHQFQSEVGQLLQLISHSLYSHPEIFLRELVSNASDALDKLKYLTLTDDAYKQIAFDPRIDIEFDEKEGTSIAVSDSGIGMNSDELIANIGTIARSGTKRFLAEISEKQRTGTNLIGRFGVGFYSVFMVADRVEVLTRRAGEERAWLWRSDGSGGYEIEPAEKEECGSVVRLFLNEESRTYANSWQIQEIVRRYSNHVPFPIYLRATKREYDDKGAIKNEQETTEQINSASALWMRPRKELNHEDYTAFYRTISYEDEDPLLYIHTQAEGALAYTTLFYIPRTAPPDLYQVDYQSGLKLYVNRVFITDDEKELMPVYLRFLRGIIDSEDLPLNVSRETLQQNRVLVNIRNASVKRVLNELKRVALEEQETYKQIVERYNRPLKEGLYQDIANRESLLELVRFKSTTMEGYTSLADYKQRMLPDQKDIHYIAGDNEKRLRSSPLLDVYREQKIEVLIMDSEIDELIIPAVGSYKEHKLKPINRGAAGDDLKVKSQNQKHDIGVALRKVKTVLGERVKDVVASVRLSDSPSCIVVDENDPTMKMQQLLKTFGHQDVSAVKPILELNPDHAIIKQLLVTTETELVEDISYMLLDQALLIEDVPLRDPAEFTQRLNRLLARVS